MTILTYKSEGSKNKDKSSDPIIPNYLFFIVITFQDNKKMITLLTGDCLYRIFSLTLSSSKISAQVFISHVNKD